METLESRWTVLCMVEEVNIKGMFGIPVNGRYTLQRTHTRYVGVTPRMRNFSCTLDACYSRDKEVRVI